MSLFTATLCLHLSMTILNVHIIEQLLDLAYAWYQELSRPRSIGYPPQPSADNIDLSVDNSWYHAQPHPIIVYNSDGTHRYRDSLSNFNYITCLLHFSAFDKSAHSVAK